MNVSRRSPLGPSMRRLNHRRAEQVAGVHERRLQSAADVERRVVGHRLQAQQRPVHVAAIVQRLDLRLALVALAVEIGGVFFLNLGGVAEHDGGQGARGRRAVDRAGEALLDQVGQVAAVVDVGVAEQHRVDVSRAEGKLAVAARLSARRPWNRPQSSSSDCPQASTWCIEPVTVRAAPQKVTVGSARRLRFLAIQALYGGFLAKGGRWLNNKRLIGQSGG